METNSLPFNVGNGLFYLLFKDAVMEKRLIPTPRQYLTDLVAASRIKEAQASGNSEEIANAQRCYANLAEDEVIYGSDIRNPYTNRFKTSMTVYSRGFRVPAVTFSTGSVERMLDPNASVMDYANSLATVTRAGFYYVRDVKRYHVVCEPNTNIWEALKLTGYEFDIKSFKFVEYATGFDPVVMSNGHVDISCPIVEGRLMITYLNNSAAAFKEEAVTETQPVELKAKAEPLQEEVKEETAPVEEKPEETPKEESPSETPAEEKAPATQQAKKKR